MLHDKVTPTAQSPGRGLPITLKLPLLVGGLLVVVTGIQSWAAYGAVGREAFAAATARLGAVTDQLAGLLGDSRRQLATAVRGLADSGAVRAYVAQPGERLRARALAVLRPTGPQSQQIAAVELWGPDRRRLLAVGDPDRWGSTAAAAEVVQTLTPADTGRIGRFRAIGDSLVYAVAAPVVGGGRVRGYVVQWRRVTSSPQSRERTDQLIGSNAHLYLGNASDSVWTDLSQRVPRPPVDVSQTSGVLHYARPGGGATLAALRAVPRTPWLVLVEFPRELVVAPARLFLRQSLLVGGVILLLGLASAWALSRTLTGPLEERVRARTAELQERNEELEAFAYSISRDLQAPLRAMDGFSRTMLEDYGDRLDAAGRQYAERVATSARRMDELIRDLLAYSHVTRSDLRLAPLDLGRVVRAAVEQLEGEVRNRGARIVVQEPLPRVVGHDTTLAQVIANLLANGMKFVPPGRTPEVRVRSETRDGIVRLWIEDNGIGIAPEYHERIFRVFERLNVAEQYPGTGIGLAIVRRGVERMGGRVGLESAVGSGSRFWVELDRAEAEDAREGGRDSAG